MKIGVIGSNGFLGQTLTQFFKADGICLENYSDKIGQHYDVIINANGNSRKYWASQNVLSDFELSTLSVYQSIFDFPCNQYIYISSVDVGRNVYGFHKDLSEQIIKQHKENYIILRCAALLGSGLKKGVVFDVEHGFPLYASKDSQIQFIDKNEVCRIIKKLLDQSITRMTLAVGGSGSTSISFIESLFKTKSSFAPDPPLQIYDTDVTALKELFPDLKSSDEYVVDYHDQRMEQSI